MISEHVFHKASLRARYEGAPLLHERNCYLAHLVGRGISQNRLRQISNLLIDAIRLLDLQEPRGVTGSSLMHAERRRWEDLGTPERKAASDSTLNDFRRTATNWLRYSGLLIEESQPPVPYGDLLPNFLSYLKSVRGMADISVRNCRFRMTSFLKWAFGRRGDFGDITLHDVEQYIEVRRQYGDTLSTIITICIALRAFFRYAEAKKLTKAKIAVGIRAPSVPRSEPSPKGPPWRDVRRMIDSCSGDTADGLRARAVLLLLAVYGLRSSELSGLRLSDIDWYDESFLVRRAKNGGVQRFPLQFEVGDAILNYLRRGRPRCVCRNIFVTRGSPHRALSAGAVLSLVKRKIQSLGIEAPQFGPRGFRHACATQLLHKGYSLAEIADFLGHRTMTSVSIYATPSAHSIRKVAAFDFRGLK